MALIKLGSTPKSFKRSLTVDMIDGTKGSIEVTYRYRTNTEFGKFLDAVFKDAGIAPEAGDDEKVVLEKVMEKKCGTNADYLIQVVDGWNLECELTKANLQQLCNEFPGVSNVVMETYRTAVTEGRAKN